MTAQAVPDHPAEWLTREELVAETTRCWRDLAAAYLLLGRCGKVLAGIPNEGDTTDKVLAEILDLGDGLS